jgi:hypothetical protein
VVSPASFAPALSSNPGASHTLFLNFNGDYRASWSGKDPNGNTWSFPDVNDQYAKYRGIGTLPFERTDLTPLTDAQRAQITEIWARVAEAYAPFDVNVTTVDPGNLDHGKTLMVNIGMSNDWFTAEPGATGISDIGNFTDQYPNVDFVFLEHFGFYNDPSFAAQVANTVSHEAGHSFGLLHHHVLNADGTLQKEYDPGFGNWSPIMGDPLEDTRHTWSIGMTGEVGLNADGTIKYDDRQIQVDTNVLGSVLGFRADDFGDDIANATPLDMVDGSGTISGIVGLRQFDLLGPVNRDVDVFSFDNTFGGQVTIRADVLGYHNGSNLNAHIELWSKDGMIASADPYDDQGNAQLTANLAPGTYYVKVTGVGAFDAGQYTLTVQAPSSFGRLGAASGVDRVGQINGFAADTNSMVTVDANISVVGDSATMPDAEAEVTQTPDQVVVPAPVPAGIAPVQDVSAVDSMGADATQLVATVATQAPAIDVAAAPVETPALDPAVLTADLGAEPQMAAPTTIAGAALPQAATDTSADVSVAGATPDAIGQDAVPASPTSQTAFVSVPDVGLSYDAASMAGNLQSVASQDYILNTAWSQTAMS